MFILYSHHALIWPEATTLVVYVYLWGYLVIEIDAKNLKQQAQHLALTGSFSIPIISTKKLFDTTTSNILWQGKAISAVKTFGTKNCSLCNQERLHIFYRSKKSPGTLINFCNEIFGACRHRTRFHRYIKVAPGTDDSIEEEKVTPNEVTTEV